MTVVIKLLHTHTHTHIYIYIYIYIYVCVYVCINILYDLFCFVNNREIEVEIK